MTRILIHRIFIDSAVFTHSNSSFTPVKDKKDHYLLTKKTGKVTSAVMFKYVSAVYLVNLSTVLCTEINPYQNSPGGNHVTRSIWQDNLIFSLTSIKARLMLIQIKMHCKWIEKSGNSEFKI